VIEQKKKLSNQKKSCVLSGCRSFEKAKFIKQ